MLSGLHDSGQRGGERRIVGKFRPEVRVESLLWTTGSSRGDRGGRVRGKEQVGVKARMEGREESCQRIGKGGRERAFERQRAVVCLAAWSLRDNSWSATMIAEVRWPDVSTPVFDLLDCWLSLAVDSSCVLAAP
eukprot:3380298-Rhodomonas_salina.3